MKIRLLIIAVASVFLSGCATLYSKKATSSDDTGWIASQQAQDTFKVQFKCRPECFSPESGVRIFTFTKASEITLANSYNFFIVINEHFAEEGLSGFGNVAICCLEIKCFKDIPLDLNKDYVINAKDFIKAYPVSPDLTACRIEWKENIDELYSFHIDERFKKSSNSDEYVSGNIFQPENTIKPTVLFCVNDVYLRNIDGKKISKNQTYHPGGFYVEVEPGTHVLTVEYLTPYTLGSPISIPFIAESGVKYVVKAIIEDSKAKGWFKGAGSWHAEIKKL